MKVNYSAFLSSLCGVWSILPEAKKAVQALTERCAMEPDDMPESMKPPPMPGGVCVIPMVGPMVKYGGFWGCSSMETMAMVNAAAKDPACSQIMLYIDSPGGSVAGISELASAVALAGQTKPVIAQVSDLCASAAYWVASACNKVYANKMALVGSIGVYAVVDDYSKMFEQMGISVQVVGTGDYKGMGEPGTKVTPEQIQYVRDMVNAANEQFMGAVAAGRGMDIRSVRKVADGRAFPATEAQTIGLIDKVQGMDQTLAQMVGARKGKSARAELRLRLARMENGSRG